MVVQELFEIDLAQLEKVAIQFDKGDENRRDFKGIYAECATILRQVSIPRSQNSLSICNFFLSDPTLFRSDQLHVCHMTRTKITTLTCISVLTENTE